MKIRLEELATALEQSDMLPGYVDLSAGRVILLKDDWQDDAALEHAMRMEENFDRYVPLTNVCDCDEYDAMVAFAKQQEPQVRSCLEQALERRGASPRFHRQIRRLHLQASWKFFWHNHLLEAARFFCEENRIAYEE